MDDSAASDPEEPPPLVNNERFTAFADAAAACADHPAAGLLHRSPESESRLGTFRVEGKWLSARARSADDVTLAVNLDRSRLHMLRGQCVNWGGPISAAIYQPLQYFRAEENAAVLADLGAELAALQGELEAGGACAMDVALVSELRHPDQLWAYPYNTMRNQAIARARSKLVLLLDADFLPNAGLREAMLRPAAWRQALVDTHLQRHVLVLPAFETRQGLPLEEGGAVAQRAADGDKRSLRAAFRAGDVTRFAPFYKRGHSATNYTRWFSSAQGYAITPEPGYEPFVVLSRLHVPWFDERFRGYGWDKITHIFHMLSTGFSLVAHPSGWVVHRPHPPSSAYNKTFTGPAYTKEHKPTQELKKLDRLAKEMMAQVKEKSYPEFGVTVLAGCRPVGAFTREEAEELRLGGWRERGEGGGSGGGLDGGDAWW